MFPISEVGSLPYQFPDEVTAAKTFYDVVTQKAQDEWKDVQILGVTVIAPAQYRGNVEINGDVSKFEGTRMRSGGKIETWILEAFGATPVEIGTGDLSTSLERGMADGAFLSYSLILAMAKDFTKYTTGVRPVLSLLGHRDEQGRLELHAHDRPGPDHGRERAGGVGQVLRRQRSWSPRVRRRASRAPTRAWAILRSTC